VLCGHTSAGSESDRLPRRRLLDRPVSGGLSHCFAPAGAHFSSGDFKVGSLGRGGISEAASLVIENPAIYVAAFADPALAGRRRALKDTEDVPTFPRMWECVRG